MFIVRRGADYFPVDHGEGEFLIPGLNIVASEAGGKPI